jgi:hypothetical protein
LIDILVSVVPTTAAVLSEDEATLKMQEPIFVTSRDASVDTEEKYEG